MKPGFTPGPWEIDWRNVEEWRCAKAVGPIDFAHDHWAGWHIAASEPDIHLIAAAPDMYEVVVRCREVYGKYGALVNEPFAPGELIAMIDAALAKANGETQ